MRKKTHTIICKKQHERENNAKQTNKNSKIIWNLMKCSPNLVCNRCASWHAELWFWWKKRPRSSIERSLLVVLLFLPWFFACFSLLPWGHTLNGPIVPLKVALHFHLTALFTVSLRPFFSCVTRNMCKFARQKKRQHNPHLL